MSSYLKYLLFEARSEFILKNKNLIEDIWYVLCREKGFPLDRTEEEKFQDVKEFLNELETNKFISKYLNWVVREFVKVNWRYPEDIDKLEKNLNKFYRSLAYLKREGKETNLDKYSMSDFNQLMIDLPETNRQEDINIKNNEVDKIYEDSKWVLLTPKTREAAILYGKGTQWCTAATESTNYFDYYNDRGPLYILINKKNPEEKYQYHLPTNSFMDITDCEVNPKEINAIFNANPELKKSIKKTIIDSQEIDLSPLIEIDEGVLKDFLENIEKKVYLGLDASTLCQALFDENITQVEDWEIEAEDVLSSVDTTMADILDSYHLKISENYKIMDFLFGSGYKESSITPLNNLRKAIITVLNQTKAGQVFEQDRVSELYNDMKEFAKKVIEEIFNTDKIYYYFDSIEVNTVGISDNYVDTHLCDFMIDENTSEGFLASIPFPTEDFEYYYDVSTGKTWNNFVGEKLAPKFVEYLNTHPEIIEDMKKLDMDNPEEGQKEVTNYDPYAYMYND